ncbi:MAG: twitching motility protein PilT [Nitrospirae bacterium RBG_16_64_22]|nr:MAG: twitching motility protein PilT [Nitrospirae bacterium RBG_16_64_22]
MTLVDTDVLVWFLRGNRKAADALERLDGFAISAVTYMELVQGMRNKEELRILRTATREWQTETLPLNEAISNRAVFYVEQHFHEANLRLADALIAATAVVNGMPLFTGNIKHYKMISDLSLKVFRAA